MEKLILRIGTAILAAWLAAIPADADAPREVNITSDSAPGWIPSAEQSAKAERTARAYLAAEDSGDVKAAYEFFTPLNRSHLPTDEYKAEVAHQQAELGPLIERRFVKITWTKDPRDAPVPGIYAAIDLVSRYTKADRHCGYLILYQPDSDADFLVMREETSIMTNATFAEIARTKSPAEADAWWAKLSANCPNYPGMTVVP